MTYDIHAVEWWPVYVLEPHVLGPGIEIPDDLLHAYQEAEVQWETVQARLRALSDEHDARKARP